MKHSLFLLLVLFISCNSNELILEVSSTSQERTHGIISFPIPDSYKMYKHFELLDLENQNSIPVQRRNDELVFQYLDTLGIEKGQQFILRPGKEEMPAAIKINQSNEEINIQKGGESIMTYNIQTVSPPAGSPDYYKRSGFIHPLKSPKGITLTDGFPTGHTHQHGIFMTWVNTSFKGNSVDFWNQQHETGTVEHKQVLQVNSGPVFSEFEVSLEHVSLLEGIIIEEDWKVRFYDFKDLYVLDFESEQENITNDTLYINSYHYGGFAFRGSTFWNRVDSLFHSDMKILTSDGKTRLESNHTHPNWVAAYGHINGETAGIAIMGHPDNFRFPQAVRIHPEMPYFCFAPMVDGGFNLLKDQKYVSKYRLLIFDGVPKEKLLETLWKDYSNPINLFAKN